ncbi:DsbA family protein [Patescibacteria group bacterium]|nr:DsbA family protein [Patescibacteria group bacterium]MBU4017412.1 DsbA family protein [Patescibacteria group bacterium]
MKLTTDVKLLIGVGLFTAIVVVAAAFTIGNKPSKKDQEQKVLGESQMKILLRKDTHLAGASRTEVTVVEFGDFQCPACAVAYQVVNQIKKKYEGKVRFAFREFPLMAHKNGYSSALAAETAGGQGMFWEMHDMLYDNQKEWSDRNDAIDIFTSYAKKIGIDADKFKKDVEDKKYDAKIQNDLKDGNMLGVNATPTFFINGKKYSGVLAYDIFKSMIESELKKGK